MNISGIFRGEEKISEVNRSGAKSSKSQFQNLKGASRSLAATSSHATASKLLRGRQSRDYYYKVETRQRIAVLVQHLAQERTGMKLKNE